MTADFHFDESKRFAENCEAFLETLKTDDPEMAAILRDNWDALVAVVREEERDSKACGEFNARVASALDAPGAPAPAGDVLSLVPAISGGGADRAGASARGGTPVLEPR